MASRASSDITSLLAAWGTGEQAVRDQLLPLVYDELSRLARGRLRRERADHTLETAGLVNEAYLRLVDQRQVGWQSRGHFYALAAQMMRRVLVDHARRRNVEKRGGDADQVALDDASLEAAQPSRQVLAIDDALDALAAFDARKAKMVELRFFGGLSIDETAAALAISPGTVMRDWTLAKAWLRRELQRTA